MGLCCWLLGHIWKMEKDGTRWCVACGRILPPFGNNTEPGEPS